MRFDQRFGARAGVTAGLVATIVSGFGLMPVHAQTTATTPPAQGPVRRESVQVDFGLGGPLLVIPTRHLQDCRESALPGGRNGPYSRAARRGSRAPGECRANLDVRGRVPHPTKKGIPT